MKVVFKARQTPKGTNGPDSASEAASVRLARAGGDFTGHGGIYCDPPFPGPGDKYTHKFGESCQRRLAAVLASFNTARVVIRYYRHPLIEELYPRDRWTWVERTGRTQSNGDAAEVLILNGPSYGEVA